MYILLSIDKAHQDYALAEKKITDRPVFSMQED